jgi:hypothetical protein
MLGYFGLVGPVPSLLLHTGGACFFQHIAENLDLQPASGCAANRLAAGNVQRGARRGVIGHAG